MVDAVSNNANSLLRAQAAGSVAQKATTPANAVTNNIQKTAVARVKNVAIPQTTKTANTSGNLPRGSLVDILA